MRELAHRLGLATSTVTRLVDRLEARASPSGAASEVASTRWFAS